MTEKHRNALQAGYDLFWYRIDKVLGQGAFGITYLAHDVNLDRQVAIKEYLPSQLCMRDAQKTVQPLSAEHSEDFKFGLERFITEARTLTKFEHPNLIRVFNVFEANNTAYMVMNYETGESLQNIAKRKTGFNEEELRRIMLPLMNGLAKMHSTGFIHRDIKPGNIFIRSDSSPVLLDFGSARQTRQANPMTLTNFVSPGYAPIEQYASKSDKQGPWTDVYGLGATVYKLITGNAPVNAIDRSETITSDQMDCYIPLANMTLPNFSPAFLKAIDHALLFRAMDRPQSIEEWRNEFGFADSEIETIPVPVIKEDAPTDKSTKGQEKFVERTVRTVKTTASNNKETEATTVKIDNQEEEKTIKQPPPSVKSKYKVTAFIATLVLVFMAVSIISYQKLQKPDTRPEETISTNEENVPETIPVTTETVVPEATQQQVDTSPESVSANNDEKNRLLTQAEENVKALRLTSPKENNAYDQYLQVLALDLENQQAKEGIHNISDKYIGLSYSAMRTGELNRAERYINKAESIWPESEKIAPARAELKKARQQQTTTSSQPDSNKESSSGTTGSDDSVFDDVKEWFKENKERQKKLQKNKQKDELRDKILDAM